jgi:hypothetical protein
VLGKIAWEALGPGAQATLFDIGERGMNGDFFG